MAPGARNKFGAPMFKPEVIREQIYCIEESTCVKVGTFRRSPVIQRPGCVPILPHRYAPEITVHRKQCTKQASI